MSVFAVILDREGAPEAEQVRARLEDKFELVYEYTPNVFMVSTDALTADVARAVGIKGKGAERVATGAVFRISGYSGYTDRSLWEWFEQVDL